MAEYKADQDLLKREIIHYKALFEKAKLASNESAEIQKRNTLSLYVNELFMIIQDSSKIRRQITELSDSIKKCELAMEKPLVSPKKLEKLESQVDQDEFKIIELKISLSEYEDDYSEIANRIYDLSQQIQGDIENAQKVQYM